MPAIYVPRCDLFDHYTLAAPLPPQFALSGLLKIPAQMQSKRVVTFSEWLSVASGSLGLGSALATAIFEAFCAYATPRADRLEAVRDELAWRQSDQTDTYQRIRKVPLSPFLIFVFCQQFRANNLGSTAAGGSAWREHPSSSEAVGQRAGDHERVTAFVTQHLYHLLALAAPKYKINFEQLQALNLLLAEVSSTTPRSELETAVLSDRPFGLLMHFWPHDKTAAVDIHSVAQYIIDNMAPPSKLGFTPLDASNPRAPLAAQPNGSSPGEILWGTASAPRRVGVVRGVVRSMVYKQTPVHGRVDALQVYDCHHANLYLLGGFTEVSVVGCTNATIILGVCGGNVALVGCSNVTVVAATRGVLLHEVTASQLFLCTNAQPQILSGCEGVELAPYNTHYPALETHLKEQAVSPLLNLWNQPLHVAKGGVSLLPPSNFASVTVPFTSHPGPTHANPCSMPAEYRDELKRKVSLATRHCSVLKQAAQGSNNTKNEMAKRLADGFKEWLQSSGNLRHVVELLHYNDEM